MKLPRLGRKKKVCDVPGCGLTPGHGPTLPFATLPRSHKPAARTLRDLRAARIGPIWGCQCPDLKHAKMAQT